MATEIHRPAPLLTPAADRRARIAALEVELARLRRDEDDELIAVIAHDALVRKDGGFFSAAELFPRQVPNLDLRDAFAAAGIRSRHQLGKHLRRLQGPHGIWALGRVKINNQGVLWSVKVIEDFHQGPSPASAVGV